MLLHQSEPLAWWVPCDCKSGFRGPPAFWERNSNSIILDATHQSIPQ
nr:MAG TPA_asm: hypothetical protein [Caudoviricetes sp.]